jgi:hypothetical protein
VRILLQLALQVPRWLVIVAIVTLALLAAMVAVDPALALWMPKARG